jgi:hypothetical protein
MGMDVFGNNPVSEQGEYFRANVWWWSPLANYCREVAPEITARCRYWQTNDGDGLNAADTLALAEILQREIKSGHTATYARMHEAEQELTPNKPCELCEGTGIRNPAPLPGAGHPHNGGVKCNGCDGNGVVRPFSTNYPFSAEFVERFVAFLRECGGFRIC